MTENEVVTEDVVGEIVEDDFIKHLRQQTDADKDGQPKPEPQPKPSEEKKDKPVIEDEEEDDDDDLDEATNPELLSDILFESFDLLHNTIMQKISGVPNPDAFKVPVQGKKRIKKAAAKLISRFNFKLHPGVALLFLILIVYGPSTVKAFAIKKQKANEDKVKSGELDKDDLEVKRGPGRPPGTTKKAA